MSYLETRPAGRNPYAVGGVLLFHAALGWALVNGLAVTIIDAVTPAPIATRNIPVQPPAPAPLPPLPQQLDPVDVPMTAPVIDILVPVTPMEDAGPSPLPPGPPVVARDPLPPAPPAVTSAAPVLRAAMPMGGSVRIGRDDYPAASLRAGEEGSMRLRVTIGADGRVSRCAVAASTGHPRLDARACEVAQRRWRFTPATEDGRPVASVAERGVTWRLEDGR